MLQQYNVHVFAILHVKMLNIEAGSHEGAMEKAEKKLWDRHRLFERERPAPDIDYTELADGEPLSHFLVDEVGDEEYENSRWYNGDRSLMVENHSAQAPRVMWPGRFDHA